MFEQKKTKQIEQNLPYSTICSREVALKRAASHYEVKSSPHYRKIVSARPRISEAGYAHLKFNKPRRIRCRSYNVATPSNNWRKFGSAALEISIFLLQNSNLPVFMLVVEKAEYASKENMCSPLKELTR